MRRDINQESPIEQGLKSGHPSTGEAAKLEHGESRINQMEKNTLKDSDLSQQEADRIERTQNAESNRINQLKHNDVTGTNIFFCSHRMQTEQCDATSISKAGCEQGVSRTGLSHE